MSYQKPQVLAENPIKTLSMAKFWSREGCFYSKGW